VVDAGNVLFRKPPTSEARRKEALLKVDVLVKAYEAMGYSAVNIGEKDLTLGFGSLREIANRAKFPFISANLIERKTRKTVFRPFITKEIAGIRIGIIGLMSRWVNEVLKEKEPYLEVLDPLAAAKPYITELRKSCDLIIVLSQLGERGDRGLALKVPGIDIIVGGGWGKRIRSSKVGETIMYRLEPRGGYLGKLGLFLTRKGKPLNLTDYEQRERIVKKMETIQKRWVKIKREIEGDTEKSPSRREVRLKELAILERRVMKLQLRLVDFDRRNLYKNEAIPIKLAIRDDPAIGKMIEGYSLRCSDFSQHSGGQCLSGSDLLQKMPYTKFRGLVRHRACQSNPDDLQGLQEEASVGGLSHLPYNRLWGYQRISVCRGSSPISSRGTMRGLPWVWKGTSRVWCKIQKGYLGCLSQLPSTAIRRINPLLFTTRAISSE
jgi:hypothetical protein